MDLKLYNQNTRGLRTKIPDFFQCISTLEFDLVCITETWLKQDILDSELSPSNYNIYRNDRDAVTSGKRDGGGVLIAVRSTLKSSEVTCVASHGIVECLWVCVDVNASTKLFICCLYVPPHATLNNLLAFFSILEDLVSKYTKHIFLVVGDFNLPNIIWTSDVIGNVCIPSGYSDALSECLVNYCSLLDLKQFNNVSNVHGKILDLVLCTINNTCAKVSPSDNPFVKEDQYHKAIEADFTISVENLMSRHSYEKFAFGRCDYSTVNGLLKEEDWREILKDNILDICVEKFYNLVMSIINKSVPKQKVNIKSFPMWFSRTTIGILEEKKKQHRKWKLYQNQYHYNEFARLRKLLKQSINCDYKNYITKTEANIAKDPKRFWSFLNKKKSTKTIPSQMHYNNQVASDCNTICRLFSSFFASVYVSRTTPVSSEIDCNHQYSFNILNISKLQVERALNRLDLNKYPGSDGIPPKFLRLCSKSVLIPLHIIFNKCLQTGTYPKLWKLAHIIPSHKSGDKSDVSNYRPISLLSHMGKIFESIVADELFFIAKLSITLCQHGFYKQRSVLTNLVPFVQDIFSFLEQGISAAVVYTDFSKAFDKVHHPTLLAKLRAFGVHGNLLSLIGSYLTDRKQHVTINNYKSVSTDVTSGVPQGSHLGPLLFSISSSDYSDMQRDINALETYCQQNLLFFNISKCRQVLFSRQLHPSFEQLYIANTAIETADIIKDLGVYLDSKLTFQNHIDNTVRRSWKILGFILRSTKDFQKYSTAILLFKTLVRPILEYALTVWNPIYNKYIVQIEGIQIKFINTLNYRYNKIRYNFSYPNNLAFYNVESLRVRRNFNDIVFVYKVLNDFIDSSYCLNFLNMNCQPYVLRNRFLLCKPRTLTNFQANSPLIRCIRLFNEANCADIDCFGLSLFVFKKKLKIHLINTASIESYANIVS